MNKKTIATFLVLSVLTFGLVSPAFAQSQQPSTNPGFFGMFTSFFAKMFHPSQSGQQGTDQNAPTGDQNAPTGMPTGAVGTTAGEGQTRPGLMINSKMLTQAQQQEVTAELAKLKGEISAWSTSTGINAIYLYSGLRMTMPMGIAKPSGEGQAVEPTGIQGKPGMQGGNYEYEGGQGGVPAGKPLQGGMMEPQSTQK